MNNAIWKIKNRDEIYTDEELINMIKKGILSGEDEITCDELNSYLKIKDTIYQFYLEVEDENI